MNCKILNLSSGGDGCEKATLPLNITLLLTLSNLIIFVNKLLRFWVAIVKI